MVDWAAFLLLVYRLWSAIGTHTLLMSRISRAVRPNNLQSTALFGLIDYRIFSRATTRRDLIW